MDVDRFLSERRPDWDRLHDLTQRAARSVARMPADELDELVSLYRQVSTDLSFARTQYFEPGLEARLSQLVAAAGAVVAGSRPRQKGSLRTFFAATFPAAVWRIRWFIAVSAIVTLLPALAMGVWLANSDRALEASGPAAVRQTYVDQSFASYYSSEPASSFATKVFTNNVRVAFMAYAFGVILCIPTAGLLAFNGANVGVAGGLFAAAGEQAKFWGLILPHGLLELTAVIIAGAAGLRLGWTVIDPGDRIRSVALAEEGRRSVVVVLGLILAFLVAGMIEGFVTGSTLSTAIRVSVGVTAEVAFLLYIVTFGRQAERAGVTGDLDGL